MAAILVYAFPLLPFCAIVEFYKQLLSNCHDNSIVYHYHGVITIVSHSNRYCTFKLVLYHSCSLEGSPIRGTCYALCRQSLADFHRGSHAVLLL